MDVDFFNKMFCLFVNNMNQAALIKHIVGAVK